MELVLMLIIGALAGAIASYIMKSPHGILMDIVLGIVGAFIGGLLMNAFGQSGVNGFNIYSIFVATLGAVIVIAIHRMFIGRRVA